MGAKAEPATTLSRGETLAFQGDGKRLAIAGEAQIPESWPDGWAEYRSIRLDRLVAEANRYAVLPIMIDDPATAARSEEHTSELQSLMRISYADFSLKQKHKT